MTEIVITNKRELSESEQTVLKRFIEFQKAMIEKNLTQLNEIITDYYTLTHMSGKTQTKQEYIDEIMNGTLNYYKSTIDNLCIEINENKAILKADVTLNAKSMETKEHGHFIPHNQWKKSMPNGI